MFGLGATLYQAAAGSWPRAEATTGWPARGRPAAAIGRPRRCPAISRRRSIARSRSSRRIAPTARELAEMLAGTGSPPGLVARPAIVPTPVRPPVRWKPWAIGAGIIGLLVVLALATGDGCRGPRVLRRPAGVALATRVPDVRSRPGRSASRRSRRR